MAEYLPSRLKLVRSVDSPLDLVDEQKIFQLKLNGNRAAAKVLEETVQLYSKNLSDITNQKRFAPIVRQLPKAANGHTAVFDGEIVRVEDSAGSHSLRTFWDSNATIIYGVFDIMSLDGKSLAEKSLEYRLDVLTDVLKKQPNVQPCPTFGLDDLPYLVEVVALSGLEGIVAKDKASKYRQRAKTVGDGDWLKWKVKR